VEVGNTQAVSYQFKAQLAADDASGTHQSFESGTVIIGIEQTINLSAARKKRNLLGRCRKLPAVPRSRLDVLMPGPRAA
jgi:hypothetical protein